MQVVPAFPRATLLPKRPAEVIHRASAAPVAFPPLRRPWLLDPVDSRSAWNQKARFPAPQNWWMEPQTGPATPAYPRPLSARHLRSMQKIVLVLAGSVQ